MDFTTFDAAYRAAFAGLMAYTPDEVGSIVFAEKLGALEDINPAWADQVQAALDAEHYAVFLQLTQE